MQQLIKDESEPLVCACDVALGVLSRRQDLPVSHNVETLRSHDTSQGCVARMSGSVFTHTGTQTDTHSVVDLWGLIHRCFHRYMIFNAPLFLT